MNKYYNNNSNEVYVDVRSINIICETTINSFISIASKRLMNTSVQDVESN